MSFRNSLYENGHWLFVNLRHSDADDLLILSMLIKAGRENDQN